MTDTPPEEERPTVLLVEDDVGLADLFAAWLADSYDVRVAYNCDAAFRELDATVDVAVLDRHLPDGSGDDIVAAIREREFDCGVAMVTAVRPDADVATMGFDEYLVKPVGREELRDTVSRLVRLSAYEQTVREFFAVVSKKALFETHVPASDLEQMAEYEQLVARAAQLEAELTAIAAQFTPAQFDAACSRLSVEAFGEPFTSTAE